MSGYSGRLNQEIRIKRGLSYGAGSVLDTRRDVGPFLASAQTKNESGAVVADLLIGEIGRLSSAPPAMRINATEGSVIGNFSRNLETAADWWRKLHRGALWYGLDEINLTSTTCKRSVLPTFKVCEQQAGREDQQHYHRRKCEGVSPGCRRSIERGSDSSDGVDLNTALLRKKQPADSF